MRSYLQEEVHIAALESTTDELIEKLELLKDAGQLDLSPDTLSQFKRVLQTADLVKFAKSKPPIQKAEGDRAAIENIVVTTKEALPEPTEEELLQNEAYLEEVIAKKQRKRIYIAAAIFGFLLLGGIGGSFAYFGFKKVKDTVFGYPTKDLLEGEWVQSSYGFPPVLIETPEVLTRQELELPAEAAELVENNFMFQYGSYLGLFSTTVNITTYKNKENDPDFQGALGGMLASLEGNGLKNITTKEDEFNSKSGVKGLKVYGSGTMSTGPNENQKFNML